MTLKDLSLEVTYMISTHTSAARTSYIALPNCRGQRDVIFLSEEEEEENQMYKHTSNLCHHIYIRNYQKHKIRAPQTCDENSFLLTIFTYKIIHLHNKNNSKSTGRY